MRDSFRGLDQDLQEASVDANAANGDAANEEKAIEHESTRASGILEKTAEEEKREAQELVIMLMKEGSEAGTGVASVLSERQHMASELAQLTQQSAGSGATTFTKRNKAVENFNSLLDKARAKLQNDPATKAISDKLTKALNNFGSQSASSLMAIRAATAKFSEEQQALGGGAQQTEQQFGALRGSLLAAARGSQALLEKA